MKLILIGYKHSGKTTLGKILAQKMHLPFFDLDEVIQKNYFHQYQNHFSCREIMKKHGEFFFRNFELNCLRDLLKKRKSGIFSLGGGAAIRADQHKLFETHLVFHLCVPKKTIWDRLNQSGLPAFFPKQDAELFFKKDFYQKTRFYFSIANYTIYHHSVFSDFKKIKNLMHLLCERKK